MNARVSSVARHRKPLTPMLAVLAGFLPPPPRCTGAPCLHALKLPAASVAKTAIPALSNEVALFPGMRKGWGLSFLINDQPAPTGRSAGSLAWAGLANTYFWIDRTKRVSGVFLSQLFPFWDHTAIDLVTKFETEVYRALTLR